MTAGSVPGVGTRVRLRPSRRADIVDLALAGKLAEVDGVERGADGRIYVAVSLLGDTAVDLGSMSQLGHRFFFDPEELEPLPGGIARRVLVAGVGDVFKPAERGVSAVVEALRGRDLPQGVRVADFGLRRHDLLRALEDYDAAIVLSADLGSGDLGPPPAWLNPGRCAQITVVGCGVDCAESEDRVLEVVMSVVDDLVENAGSGEGVGDEG
ncbi:hypothetical protein [Saccharopolyspora sp. NPDC002376]